jgi:HSP20 family protein
MAAKGRRNEETGGKRMKTIVRHDPLSQLERTTSLLDEFFSHPWRPFNMPFQDTSLLLPLDIWEKDGKFKIRAAITGISPDDVNINVEDGVLTITGETKKDEEINEAKVYRRECSTGRVTRSLRLPDHVEVEKGEADFENGFVTVTFPVKPAAQPRSIEIRKRG